MGFGGIGPWQLLIVLLIVVLIFGTKRLKTLGGDLGSALKSFRKAMDTDEDDAKKGAGEQKRIHQADDDGDDAQFAEQKEERQEHRS